MVAADGGLMDSMTRMRIGVWMERRVRCMLVYVCCIVVISEKIMSPTVYAGKVSS